MDAQRKAANTRHGEAAGEMKVQTNDTTATAARQRKAILKYLLTGQHLTTLYARDHVGIMHPAARVQELRDDGHDIVTHWTFEKDASGNEHRVARYVLMRTREGVL